jgi:hypothetical protein
VKCKFGILIWLGWWSGYVPDNSSRSSKRLNKTPNDQLFLCHIYVRSRKSHEYLSKSSSHHKKLSSLESYELIYLFIAMKTDPFLTALRLSITECDRAIVFWVKNWPISDFQGWTWFQILWSSFETDKSRTKQKSIWHSGRDCPNSREERSEFHRREHQVYLDGILAL